MMKVWRGCSICLWRVVLGLAVLVGWPTLVHAQAAQGPNGFYYPVASVNPSSGFLATECDTYFSQQYHLGWDLVQPHGSPVYAITDGTIVNITNTGDPDVTFIWIQHSAVNLNTGNTITFWAVYGHTSIKSGLSTVAPNNAVHAGDIIGYTIVYTRSKDHCHLGINLNGIITRTKDYTINYLNNSGNNATAVVDAGWGAGGPNPDISGTGLPSDWCINKAANIASLQASGAVENFTDPQAFLNAYRAVGYNGGGVFDPTNIYVSLSGSDTSNGSSGTPFRTVQHAIDMASATQDVTIHITPGVYSEKIDTSNTKKHIHFVTNGSGTVKIGG